ncbi:hypothetical protein IWQ56_004024 [Coemansia nantahalensis]|nr:hypothetical protein IWQ56_004024 [Coemansia nantahalensis]
MAPSAGPRQQQQQPGPAPADGVARPYCEGFATHGHCRLKDQCPSSHDINYILDCQEREQAPAAAAAKAQEVPSNKRKIDAVDGDGNSPPRKALKAAGAAVAPAAPSGGQTETSNELAAAVTTLTVSDSGKQDMCHTAAYDAYMTGYIYASLRLVHGEELANVKNKVYRMGRSSEPLLIQASPYAAASITYKQTMPLVEASQPPKPDGGAASSSSSSSSDDGSSSDGSSSDDGSSSSSESDAGSESAAAAA